MIFGAQGSRLPGDTSAVQPTELPLRLTGVLSMNRSAYLEYIITWNSRPENSVSGLPLIVNVILFIVVVGSGA